MMTIPSVTRVSANVSNCLRSACAGVLEFFGLARAPQTERVRISPRRPRVAVKAVARDDAASAESELAGSDRNRRRRASKQLRTHDEWSGA